MKLGWGSRQILSLSALAVVLAITSVLFEIHNVLRLSTDRAVTEAGYVTDTVERTILLLNQRNPQADLATLAADPQIEQVLASGLAHAPSLLGIAVANPEGIAVAHGIPQMIGQPISELPELPRPEGFRDAMRVLLELRDRQNYEVSSELRQGDQQFATIRAQISGTLLWDEVRRVLQRGLLTGLILLFLALGLGVLLGQVTKVRMRILEEGVAAIREGRSDPIPEDGVDMFGHLARELNILRDRVQMEPRILANVGQLSAGMAHEMSQPLQAIQFALRELEDPRNLSPEELDTHVGSAKSAVERMRKSVDGFLRVVRIKPMAVEYVSLNAMLGQVQQDLETEANLAGLELDLDLDESLPETYADGQVLRQAVENLVKNAIQASPSREGRVTIRSRTGTDSLLLTVEDTGPGIPEDVRPNIFNFYFTTKMTGTGVGLALVRQAAEIHGGTIEIESETGRGTKMTIRIPQRASTTRVNKKARGRASSSVGTQEILPAEDLLEPADAGPGLVETRRWKMITGPPDVFRRVSIILGLAGLLGAGTGCALLPQFGEPPATGPVVAAPDTTRSRVPDPELWPTATETPARPDPPVERAVSTPREAPPEVMPTEVSADTVNVATADSIQVDVAPAVTVSPPSRELEEIETETLASLNEAKKLIDAVDPNELDSAGQDELRIVRGFISQAEDALTRQDVQAAAGLARKARLLAVELTSR